MRVESWGNSQRFSLGGGLSITFDRFSGKVIGVLVLSRRIGEKIVIGDGIVVTVVEVHRDSVRLGVDAPRSVPVNRAELVKAVSEENVAAMSIDAAALTSLRGIRPTAASPLDLRKLIQKSALAQGAAVSADSPGNPGSAVSLGNLSSAASGIAAGAPIPSAAPGLPPAKPAAGTPGFAIPKPRPIPKPRDPRKQ